MTDPVLETHGLRKRYGSKLAVASVSREHKHVWLRVADTATGTVRTVFDETVPTQFESRTGWRVLWATNEVIWVPYQRVVLPLRIGKNKKGVRIISEMAKVDISPL